MLRNKLDDVEVAAGGVHVFEVIIIVRLEHPRCSGQQDLMELLCVLGRKIPAIDD